MASKNNPYIGGAGWGGTLFAQPEGKWERQKANSRGKSLPGRGIRVSRSERVGKVLNLSKYDEKGGLQRIQGYMIARLRDNTSRFLMLFGGGWG